eukprot:344038_1
MSHENIDVIYPLVNNNDSQPSYVKLTVKIPNGFCQRFMAVCKTTFFISIIMTAIISASIMVLQYMHWMELECIQHMVFLCIFGILLLYNLTQWLKISCGEG